MRVDLQGRGSRFLAGGTLIFRDELTGDALSERWIAPTWTLADGVLSNLPTLGSELLTNGDMESGDPPTGWNSGSGSVLSSVADPRTGSAGAKSMNVVRGTNQSAASKTTFSGQVEWHRVESWQKNVDADYIYQIVATGQSLAQTATTWVRHINTRRVDPASALNYVQRINDAGVTSGDQMRLDDVSTKKISRPSLFACVLVDELSWRIVTPAIDDYLIGTQAGAVFCLDDPSDPQNFVIAYCTTDGGAIEPGIVIEQCVAGTYTQLVYEYDHTPGNGRHFSARKVGSQLEIYFGVGDFQTLIGGAAITLPAEIASNQYHGVMSTHEGNTFSGRMAVLANRAVAVPEAPAVINAVFGGTSITNSAFSHRRGVETWLRRTYRNSSVVAFNASQSGRTSWNNLLRIDTDYLAKQPNLIVFDNANDDYQNIDAKCVEALVRRIWALYPDCKFVFCRVFNVTDRLTNSTINTPPNASQQAEFAALAAHYDIPVANYYGRIVELVNGGGNLVWYLLDTVHPSQLGHIEMVKLLEDVLTSDFLSQRQAPETLPARLYDSAGDYENAAVIKNGTAYDSITGSWTTSGTQISSSSAGATVTYSGTFQSIGRPEEDGTVEISVDGGAYQAFSFSPNGEKIAGGVRGAHTVTIKVISGTVTISKFWAI